MYKQDKYHKGLFSSVIRFIPMSSEGARFVIDIDLNATMLSHINRTLMVLDGTIDYANTVYFDHAFVASFNKH